MTRIIGYFFSFFSFLIYFAGCQSKGTSHSLGKVITTENGEHYLFSKDKRTWQNAVKFCHLQSQKGMGTFRLPNPIEAKEFLHEKKFTGPLGGTFKYWTSYAKKKMGQHFIAYIDPSNFKIYHAKQNHKFAALCVQNNTKSHKNIWRHEEANLVWRYHPYKAGWHKGKKICEIYRDLEGENWRLPSKKELHKAFEDKIHSIKNKSFGKIYLADTWSHEKEDLYPNDAYAIDLTTNHGYLNNKNKSLAVLCVKKDGFF